MAVAHATAALGFGTDSGLGNTDTGDQTFSHAGSASAKGAFVLVQSNATGAPVTGVLYGGQTMTLVVTGVDATEAGSVRIYFLSAPPTGTQTVTLQGCSADQKHAVAGTVTAATDGTQIVGSGNVDTQSSTNPTVTFSLSAAGQVYGAVCGGLAAETSYAAGTGETIIDQGPDYGARAGRWARSTSVAGSGNYTFNFSAATDDWGIAAIAIGEAADVTFAGTIAATSTVAGALKVLSNVTSRTFDGSNDQISCALGGADLTGALTMAVLVRKASNAGKIFLRNAGGGGAVYIGSDTSNRLALNTGAGAVNSTTTFTAADGWVLVAVTKAASTTTPNAHIFKGGSWTHEAMSGTQVDPSSQAGGTVDFGVLAGVVFYSYDIAVAGEWTVELSNDQIEELSADTATQDWADNTGGAPVALWDFNQAAVTTDVVDLIGTSDQSARTETTVNADGPSGWEYGVAVDVTFAGTIAATSTVAGDLAVIQPLAGQIDATATVSGALVRDPALAGQISATSTLAGALAVEQPFAGQIDAISTVSGALAVDPVLAGQIDAAATVAGELTVEIPVTFAGTVAATSTVAGALARDPVLAGQIDAVSTLAGALSIEVPLAGQIDAIATLAGALTVVGSVTFAGTVAAASTVTGALARDPVLAGQIDAASGVAGALTRDPVFSGQIDSNSTVTGALTVVAAGVVTFAGQISATSTLAGTLSLDRPLAGQIAATSTVTGALARDPVLAGQIDTASTAVGALTVVTGGDVSLAGLIATASTAAGDLTVFTAVTISGPPFLEGSIISAYEAERITSWRHSFQVLNGRLRAEPPAEPVETHTMTAGGVQFTDLEPGRDYQLVARVPTVVDARRAYRRSEDRWVSVAARVD